MASGPPEANLSPPSFLHVFPSWKKKKERERERQSEREREEQGERERETKRQRETETERRGRERDGEREKEGGRYFLAQVSKTFHILGTISLF